MYLSYKFHLARIRMGMALGESSFYNGSIGQTAGAAGTAVKGSF